MNAFTANASLVLHPSDPNWTLKTPEPLINFLQKTGLAAESFDKECFLVGENFLELISFMGCSPNIKLDDEDGDGQFTFIHITGTDEIAGLTGKHSFSPHCPQCKKPEKNWRKLLKNNNIECSNCQTPSDAWQYNWRKSAGFARCFIEITDIYPKEAIPQSSLLESLEKNFGVPWAYFFYHNASD